MKKSRQELKELAKKLNEIKKNMQKSLALTEHLLHYEKRFFPNIDKPTPEQIDKYIAYYETIKDKYV